MCHTELLVITRPVLFLACPILIIQPMLFHAALALTRVEVVVDVMFCCCCCCFICFISLYLFDVYVFFALLSMVPLGSAQSKTNRDQLVPSEDQWESVGY